jgi:hypothetical protein
MTYDDTAPWPITPDNHGFSLVPVNAASSVGRISRSISPLSASNKKNGNRHYWLDCHTIFILLTSDISFVIKEKNFCSAIRTFI